MGAQGDEHLNQISGRMMLARLAGAITFLGRCAFFLTAIYCGGMLAIGMVAFMCSGPNAESELQNMITIATMLSLGALTILAISSFIAWIITGQGDLVTFALYLLARVGNFLMTMGLVIIGFIAYARFVKGGCRLANPFWVMFVGGTQVVSGMLVQLGAIVLIALWREQLEKAEMRRRGAI